MHQPGPFLMWGDLENKKGFMCWGEHVFHHDRPVMLLSRLFEKTIVYYMRKVSTSVIRITSDYRIGKKENLWYCTILKLFYRFSLQFNFASHIVCLIDSRSFDSKNILNFSFHKHIHNPFVIKQRVVTFVTRNQNNYRLWVSFERWLCNFNSTLYHRLPYDNSSVLLEYLIFLF